MSGILSKEQNVAIKALKVNLETAESNMDETIWLLPIHAQRILDAITLLVETIGTEEKPE